MNIHFKFSYFFKKQGFFKDALILAIGTIISQTFLLISTPLLIKYYSPDDFGILSLFSSITTIVGCVITGKFEQAIILPQKEKESIPIVYISLLLSFFCFVFLEIIFYLSGDKLAYLLNIKRESQFVLNYLPIGILSIGIFNTLTLLMHRRKMYVWISISIVSQTLILLFINLLFGYYKNPFGLLFGNVLSFIFANFLFITLLIYVAKLNLLKPLNFFSNQNYFSVLKKTAHDYIIFPKIVVFHQLLILSSTQIYPILLNNYYSTATVGFFSLAYRIVRAPLLIFVGAIGNVFKNELTETFNSGKSINKLCFEILKKLFLLSFFGNILLVLLLPKILTMFLGEKWSPVSVYAQILCISVFSEIIETPLSHIYTLFKKQKIHLFLGISTVLVSTIGICLGFYLFNDAQFSIILASLGILLVNFASIILIINQISKYEKELYFSKKV